MSYQPLISIVTIVYNDLDGLKKTYKSVVEQTYKNIEYLIIDGGSNDGTSTFIRKNQDNLAYWVSEKDKGISDAFNKGVIASKGEWIVFLNAADYFQNENAVASMIPFLKENQNADIVYGKLTEVDKDGNQGKSFGKPFNRKAFERECTIIHPACFHKDRFFKENGLFNLDFKIAMDYELFLRKKDLKAVFVDQPVTFMETGGTSQLDPGPSYKEANKAKAMHLNKSTLELSIEYYENMLRYRFSKIKQGLLHK
jgi:glycosyltransferase involved in cell wall biosynthesis